MARNDSRDTARCSFCGKPQSMVNRLIAGNGSFICDECVRLCMNILGEDFRYDESAGKKPEGEIDFEHLPKPADIRAHLDEYIIGQEQAKIALSVAVYNHYKRILHLETASGRGESENVELQKSNILLIGPTGSGKTLFAQTLAKMLGVPFAIADATTLTEAGSVGEDVANILFICGGAFDGLDKIIERRTDRKSLGFGADIRSAAERDVGELMGMVQSHDLLKFGIIPELIGRLPVVTSLESLKREDLVRILTEPKNALTKQYKVLLDYDGVQLEFEPDALGAIADRAIELKIGARGLRSVMEQVMTGIMYKVPSDPSIERVVVTADCVRNSTEPMVIHKPAKGESAS